jgi:hypothetical protein
MKISFAGEEYIVPAEEEILLLQQIQGIMLQEYGKLDANMRFLAKPVARGFLQKLENEARVKHGKEQALIFRPDKKQDAVIHLSNIMIGILREALQHVALEIGTVNHSIASLKVTVSRESSGRGQVAVNGDIGEWENNRSQISGRNDNATVSDC